MIMIPMRGKEPIARPGIVEDFDQLPFVAAAKVNKEGKLAAGERIAHAELEGDQLLARLVPHGERRTCFRCEGWIEASASAWARITEAACPAQSLPARSAS